MGSDKMDREVITSPYCLFHESYLHVVLFECL